MTHKIGCPTLSAPFAERVGGAGSKWEPTHSESSTTTKSGAPLFPRPLRKGWEGRDPSGNQPIRRVLQQQNRVPHSFRALCGKGGRTGTQDPLGAPFLARSLREK